MTYRKKLIEVSLPLEAINREAAREKSIRHGHPSTLHLWWARRPLAACRAVLFSSLVDDPSEYMPDEESARVERERLFGIIEKLVVWENSNNEEVLYEAQLEIARSVARNLGVDVPVGKEAVREFLATKAPPVLDPFAGGGSIPLEAQRLGLRAYASDLNPVAVLINKALIEIPPKFANMPPVHPPEEAPASKKKSKKGEGNLPLFAREWKGAQGLAEDVRYYGKWMRDEAFKLIGHLYPPVTITKEMLADRHDLMEQGLKAGDQLTVIAWLWARTVKCPNPACGVEAPLIRSFALSTKKNGQTWTEPVIERNHNSIKVKYVIKSGKGVIPDGTVNRNGARCICCDTPISFQYIRSEGKLGHIDAQMMAIVAESPKKRIYLPPLEEHEKIAKSAIPVWQPETDLPEKALGFRIQLYGMTRHADLFTKRQLAALSGFSSLIEGAQKKVREDAENNGVHNAKDYADSISVFLCFGVNKIANTLCTIARWTPTREQTVTVFARQALPMTWDFPDVNPFSGAAGDLSVSIENIYKAIVELPAQGNGDVKKIDATQRSNLKNIKLSTDPPYYDNIGYADLSDFFYIWTRHSLSKVYPELFATLLVPKSQELVATPFRFDGNRQKADEFFENGLRQVFQNMRYSVQNDVPSTIYYAFKQTESDDSEDEVPVSKVTARTSTGWETMLQGLLSSGFELTGTWPMRTELENRSVGQGTNALASSIVLVCRPRPETAISCSRREFLSALKKELAPALRELQQGSIAPVDLAQASIGPGMAVYSRYSAVLEADGKPMPVRTALGLINQALDEYLTEQEGEYDGDTRWALSWFEQFGHNEATYGVAETLSKAKNTSVEGLAEAGILEARAGKVRILRRDELDIEWDPTQDKRLTAWEACQHLIYALENEGEEAAAALLSKLGQVTEPARDLAYRLYTVCERKGWAQDALGYNSLVVAWPRLKELAAKRVEPGQGKLM
jgi:putative DNA methylase